MPLERDRFKSIPEVSMPLERDRFKSIPEVSTPLERDRFKSIPEVSMPLERDRFKSIPEVSTPLERDRSKPIPEVSTPLERDRSKPIPEVSTPLERDRSKPHPGGIDASWEGAASVNLVGVDHSTGCRHTIGIVPVLSDFLASGQPLPVSPARRPAQSGRRAAGCSLARLHRAPTGIH